MTSMVIDTDVVSFFFKRDSRAARYHRHIAGQTAAVSFMTVAELDYWAMAHSWGAARVARLQTFLGRYVFIPSDRDLCRTWAEVVRTARRAGRPIETADAWVAATALSHGVPLVTHNPTDYQGLSTLQIITESP